MKKTTYVLIAVVGLTLLSAAAAPFVWFWKMKHNPDMQILTRKEAAKMGYKHTRIFSAYASDDDTASDSDETSDTLLTDVVIIDNDTMQSDIIIEND